MGFRVMGLEKKSALLEDLIEKCGGCAVVDGGFATQLEIHGAAINDPLWSAVSLIKDPELIRRVCRILFLSISVCRFSPKYENHGFSLGLDSDNGFW